MFAYIDKVIHMLSMAQNGGQVEPWIPGAECLFSWLVSLFLALSFYLSESKSIFHKRICYFIIYRGKLISTHQNISNSQ